MNENLFAKRLAEAMRKRELKQVDLLRLAAECGMKLGKSQLSQYLSGKTVPRRNVGQLLAKLLKVDSQWLYGENRAEGDQPREVQLEKVQQAEFTSGNEQKQANGETMPETGRGTGREAEKEIPMREFKKSSKLDNVLYDVRGPVVEEATRMEDSGTQVLKLNIGNPAPFGFRTPDEVIFDMQRQLAECEGYSAAKGLFAARKAIMQYAQLKNLPNLSIDDIYTGNGVSELINLSMSALLDNGDEVLVPAPDYPLWTACVTLSG